MALETSGIVLSSLDLPIPETDSYSDPASEQSSPLRDTEIDPHSNHVGHADLDRDGHASIDRAHAVFPQDGVGAAKKPCSSRARIRRTGPNTIGVSWREEGDVLVVICAVHVSLNINPIRAWIVCVSSQWKAQSLWRATAITVKTV